LNGYPEVSEATRLRVVKAAEKYNYKPNIRAKALATGRSMSIAHLLPASSKKDIANPIFADFIAGAGEVFARHGYALTLSIVDDGDGGLDSRTLFGQASFDGIIMLAPRVDDPRIGHLCRLGLPFVVHGRSSNATEPYNWVDVNNRRAFQRATEFLADFGHRRIALVNGPENLDFAFRRHQGYLDGLSARGIAADERLMCADTMTESFGYTAAARLLDGNDPPTAFLCASIVIAFGVQRAISDRGMRIGTDVSVVTFDDELSYFANGTAEPIFTALRSSVHDAGALAADMLLAQIANPEAPPANRLLHADLIVGISTGPAHQDQGESRAG
jgi:LacI family transcriptional regulator